MSGLGFPLRFRVTSLYGTGIRVNHPAHLAPAGRWAILGGVGRTVSLLISLLLVVSASAAQDLEDGLRAGRETRARELLAAFSDAPTREARFEIVRTLGTLRMAEAGAPLVRALLELHRETQSPYRDSESPAYPYALTLVQALREIGRPGLPPFIDVLATFGGYALDLTWTFMAIHGEEGILVLEHRARSEPHPERRARLEAAAWFTRLRVPESEAETAAPGEPTQ